MLSKSCKKCSSYKDINNFYKNKKLKDGYESKCKSCISEENRLKAEINGAYLGKKNYDINKETINKKRRKFRSENKDITRKYNDNTKEYRFNYYLNNKDKINEYQRLYDSYKKETDVLYKTKSIIRNNIYTVFIKSKVVKNHKTEEILKCTFEEFKLYLESKFEDWMNWSNHGLYNGELNYGWDLDHIIPLSSAKTIDEIYELNNFRNFQPLCSYTNRYIKKDKIINYENM